MEKQAGERQRRGRACWSVSAKISECINMPRRQAEYNPSYIQISSRDHRQPRGGEAGEGGREEVGNGDVGAEYRRDSHLITLKMFYPRPFLLFCPLRFETTIFFRGRIREYY